MMLCTPRTTRSCVSTRRTPNFSESGDFERTPTLTISGFSTPRLIDDILDVTMTTEQLGKTAGKDLEANKTTYPSLLGLEKSREIADELIADALGKLSSFDYTRALPLLTLAKYIVSRKS